MKLNQIYNYLCIQLLILTLISFISLSHSIICPDSHRKCEIDTTCCLLSSGSYGCCPLPSAQCCSDGLHCCPNGTKCNDKDGTCDGYEDYVKTENHNHMSHNSHINHDMGSTDLCPDKNQTCSNYETCCKQKTGGYGCCPYKSGVCCNDGLHCCPAGTKCDLIHKQCVRQSTNYNKLSRIYSNERMRLIANRDQNDVVIKDVICPGAEYQCPDGNTCCQVGQQEWGCCPLADAVCCEDRIHCCPNKTICSPTGCQSL